MKCGFSRQKSRDSLACFATPEVNALPARSLTDELNRSDPTRFMVDTVLAEEVDPAERTLPWIAAEERHQSAFDPAGSRQPPRLPEMALRAGSIY